MIRKIGLADPEEEARTLTDLVDALCTLEGIRVHSTCLHGTVMDVSIDGALSTEGTALFVRAAQRCGFKIVE